MEAVGLPDIPPHLCLHCSLVGGWILALLKGSKHFDGGNLLKEKIEITQDLAGLPGQNLCCFFRESCSINHVVFRRNKT